LRMTSAAPPKLVPSRLIIQRGMILCARAICAWPAVMSFAKMGALETGRIFTETERRAGAFLDKPRFSRGPHTSVENRGNLRRTKETS